MSICILRTSLNLNLGWRRPYNKEKEGQKAALDYTLLSNSNFCPKIHLLLENLHSCEFDFLLKLTKYFVYFWVFDGIFFDGIFWIFDGIFWVFYVFKKRHFEFSNAL